MSGPMICACSVTIILLAAVIGLMVLYWPSREPAPAADAPARPLIRLTSAVLDADKPRPPWQTQPLPAGLGTCCAVHASMMHSTPGMPAGLLVPQDLPGPVATAAATAPACRPAAPRAGELHPASAA